MRLDCCWAPCTVHSKEVYIWLFMRLDCCWAPCTVDSKEVYIWLFMRLDCCWAPCTVHTKEVISECNARWSSTIFKITVIKLCFGVINQGHCCANVLSATDILGYNHVFIHIQLSLLQVTLMDLHVTDPEVEHVNKLKCKREERAYW